MKIKMDDGYEYIITDWNKLNYVAIEVLFASPKREVIYLGNQMADDNTDVYATFKIDGVDACLCAVRID